MRRRILLFSLTIALLLGGMLSFSQSLPTAEAAPPGNDDLANRIVVNQGNLPYTDTVDTTEATNETDEKTCEATKKVWYEFTPSVAGTYQIDTFGSDFDTGLDIWLSAVAAHPLDTFETCNNDVLGEQTSLIVLIVEDIDLGTTYYIAAGGCAPGPCGADTGNLVLNIQLASPPANDDIANRVVIPSGGLPFTTSADNIGATDEGGEVFCPGQSDVVWYEFTPAADGIYALTFPLDTTSYTPAIGLWTHNTTPPTHPLDNQVACDDGNAFIVSNLSAGTTYYIGVGSSSGREGFADLSIELVDEPSGALEEVGTDNFLINISSDRSIIPEVTHNPLANEYLVVWEQGSTVLGRRLAADGTPIGADFQIDDGTDCCLDIPVVAFNPQTNQYLVAWLNGDDDDANARFVNADGSLAGGILNLDALAGIGSDYYPDDKVDIAYDPDNNRFLITWDVEVGDDSGIYGVVMVLLAADGSFIAFDEIPYDDRNSGHPAVAYHNGQYLIVWEREPDPVDGSEAIFGVFVSIDGVAGSIFQISTPNIANPDNEDDADPDVSASSATGNFLVTWERFDSIDDGISDLVYGMLVDANGSPVSGEFVISTMVDTVRADNAKIWYNPNYDHFLVAWRNAIFNDQIMVQLFSGDGSPIGGNFPISAYETNGNFPALTYNPNDHEFLVVWAGNIFNCDELCEAIFGQRLAYPVPTIAKSFDPTSVPVTSSSVATFSLDNVGSAFPLTNMQVRDEFPAGLLVASLSGASPDSIGLTSSANCSVSANPDMVLNGSIVDFTVATLPADEICEVYLNVWSREVAEYCNPADLVTIFSSDQTGALEPDFPEVCVAFTGDAGIDVFDPSISKVGVLQVGEVGVTGEQLEWIVTVTNTSGITGNNVVVTDTIDSRMTVDNVVATGGTVSTTGQTVTVTYANLFPGQSVNFSIFTTVLDGLFVNNTACVNASNQGAEECATADALGGTLPVSLPQTGSSPWAALRLPLAIFMGLLGLAVVRRKVTA